METKRDSIIDSNDDVQGNQSEEPKSEQRESPSTLTEEDRLSWGRNKWLIIACAVLVSLPSAIPFYFGTKVEQLNAKIIFFGVGIAIILFNIWVVVYVLRRARGAQ